VDSDFASWVCVDPTDPTAPIELRLLPLNPEVSPYFVNGEPGSFGMPVAEAESYIDALQTAVNAAKAETA
jgi:hypothetical protein